VLRIGRETRKSRGTQGSLRVMEFQTLSRRDAFRNANLVEIEVAETSLPG